MAITERRARTERHSRDNREAGFMTTPWIVRPAQAGEFSHWLVLWRAYCASLDHSVSDEVSSGVWSRIISPSEAIWCLFVSQANGEPQGLFRYFRDPHTLTFPPFATLTTSLLPLSTPA